LVKRASWNWDFMGGQRPIFSLDLWETWFLRRLGFFKLKGEKGPFLDFFGKLPETLGVI